MSETSTHKIKEAVREAYGEVARQFAGQPASSGCCGSGRTSSCCGPQKIDVEVPSGADRFYSAAELDSLPETVTEASLGCGNPIAIAGLQPGEVVLDLGSGGGIDCFLAARLVGPQGRVIGLDMTPDMIHLGQRNAKKVSATNVEFRLGEMEDIPLPDASVDVVISNCVVNLSPEKDVVFQEAYRVLRPGGRLSISDIVVDGDLPPAIRSRLDAWASCIAGALDEGIYLDKIRAAGFARVEVLSRDYAQAEAEQALALLAGDGGQPAGAAEASALLAEAGVAATDLGRKIASIKVRAHKP
jgi:arsenite methyltransferase